MRMLTRYPVWLTIMICALGMAPNFRAERPRSARHSQSDATPIEFLPNPAAGSLADPATPTGTTVDVNVGPNFSFTFSPNPVAIVAGDTVRWVWKTSGHNVRSGTPCSVDSQYCSPNDMNCTDFSTSNQNSTYNHTFIQAGSYRYFCSIHCGSGMTGTVNVLSPFITLNTVDHTTNNFTINGHTTATTVATTITVSSTSDLAVSFQNPVPVTADAAGNFTYSDTSAGTGPHFYRLSYP